MRKVNAFSLIELMAVIAVISIILVIAAPAIGNISNSLNLTTAVPEIVGKIDAARQAAISRSAEVEVRIYKLPASNEGATEAPSVYRGVQTFAVTGNTTTPLTRFDALPDTIIISENSSLTNLLATAGVEPPSTFQSARIPTYGTNYQAVAFRFGPDGSVRFPYGTSPRTLSTTFFTVVGERDAGQGAGQVNNFATVQIDPFTGRSNVYRP